MWDEMKRLTKFLKGIPSGDAEALQKSIMNMGYDENLKQGDSKLSLEPISIGEHPQTGHLITVHRKGVPGTMQRVHFGKILMRYDHWSLLRERFDQEMNYWKKAKAKNEGKSMPLGKNAYKAFIETGYSKSRKRKKQEQADILLAALDKLSAKMQNLIELNIHPQRIIVYSDGPLFCRKSIHGTLLM